MKRVKNVGKKLAAFCAFALVFMAMLVAGSTEAEAKTETLHTFFTQEGDILKYGFKNDKGKVIVKAQYLEAGHFSEGLCPVSSDGKHWFYINTKGKKVFSIESSGENYWTAGNYINGVAIIEIDDTTHRTYLIDKTGKKLTDNEYRYIKRLNNGYFDATSNDDTHSILNKKGQVLIASCPGSPEHVTNYGLLFTSNDGEISVYNMKGKQILSTTEGTYTLVDNAVWFAEKENADKIVYNWSGKKIGKVDKSITLVNPDECYNILGNKLHVARNKSGKYGFVNCKGKFVIKPVYKWADEFRNGVARVTKGTASSSQECLINTKGKITVKFSKQVGVIRYASKFICLEKANSSNPAKPLTALVNLKGKYIMKFGKASDFGYIGLNSGRGKEYIPFEQKGKWGMISGDTGKVIIPAKYDNEYVFSVSDSDTDQYISATSGSTTDIYELDGTKMGSYKGTVRYWIH